MEDTQAREQQHQPEEMKLLGGSSEPFLGSEDDFDDSQESDVEEEQVGRGPPRDLLEEEDAQQQHHHEGDSASPPSSGKRKELQTREDDDNYFMHRWPLHKKHIFILSSAGKPVYSRYGDEQKLCSFMPVLSAIASFVTDAGDTIRTIYAGEHKFVFLFKEHLYLVAVSRTDEPAADLQRQLEYVYSQIISSLTAGVKKIYDQRAHFDIRDLLGDSTQFIDNLINMMEHNMTFLGSCFINAVHCLALDSTVRNAIGVVMQSFSTDDLVYSILLAKNQLVNVVRLKKKTLHSEDFHLILNFIASSGSIKQTASCTSPVCLPQFSDKGYLHFYIAWLVKDVCLLLVSTKAGNLEDGKLKIEKGLKEIGAIRAIKAALRVTTNNSYTVDAVMGVGPLSASIHEKSPSSPPPSPSSSTTLLPSPLSAPPSSSSSSASSSSSSPSTVLSNANSLVPAASSALLSVSSNSTLSVLSSPSPTSPVLSSSISSISGVPSSSTDETINFSSPQRYLLHFLYKDLRTSQFTSPKLDTPYGGPKEAKRLFRLYQRIHYRVNGSDQDKRERDKGSASKVFYYISSVMAFNLSFMFHKKQLLRQMFEELLGWVQEAKISVPPQTTFPLRQVDQAHKLIESGMSVGKLVLTTTDEEEERRSRPTAAVHGESERTALMHHDKDD